MINVLLFRKAKIVKIPPRCWEGLTLKNRKKEKKLWQNGYDQYAVMYMKVTHLRKDARYARFRLRSS